MLHAPTPPHLSRRELREDLTRARHAQMVIAEATDQQLQQLRTALNTLGAVVREQATLLNRGFVGRLKWLVTGR